MIAHLRGKIFEKYDNSAVIDVSGVGYEVFASSRSLISLPDRGSECELFVHTNTNTNGTSLFGFLSRAEKDLFLSLIKVDSVGPKSALNILSAAPWLDLAQLIEEGAVSELSKLPKISKKTAEQVVVKLKGKLGELILSKQKDEELASGKSVSERFPNENMIKPSALRTGLKLRDEARNALSHLGYKPFEVERALQDIDDELWATGLEAVIRHALSDLSGSRT